jgi:hypothetical protein
MHKWRCAVLTALGGLTLAGCAAVPPALSPADAVAALKTGQPLLHCRDACLAAWQRATPQAAQLDGAGRWAELATLVESIGYEDDLSLYYLGRAAEALGYPGAAASYYRRSVFLSDTSTGCRYFSRTCGGVVLPQAAFVRLAAIERELGPLRYPQSRPSAPPRPKAPELSPPNGPEATPDAAPEPTAAEPAAAAPPGVPPPSVPAATLPPAVVPEIAAPSVPAPLQPPGAGASDYIEPPPALH